MRRNEKFWIILLILSALFVLGFNQEEARAQNGLAFSGPIFVLLYHPGEEGFESAFWNHLNWLRESGYQTIPLETLMDYVEGKSVSLPSKPILLTFDDGTIENYEIVYPILQRFGFMGTAFVLTSPSFTRYSKKSWWKEVDRSGTLRIENHSRSHALIRVSPNIIDFYTGEAFDDYYLTKGVDWRLGAPVYEYDYELISDRYFADKRIANRCAKHVVQNGGEDFFTKEGWKEELSQVVEEFRNQHQERGYYEREGQKNLRMQTELLQSKNMIEQTIGRGKRVDFFAYPWGYYDEDLILRLVKYGYQGAFSTDFGGNYPGEDSFKIKRIVITSIMPVEYLDYILGME